LVGVSGSNLRCHNLVISDGAGLCNGLVDEELSLVFVAVGVGVVGLGLRFSGDEQLVLVILVYSIEEELINWIDEKFFSDDFEFLIGVSPVGEESLDVPIHHSNLVGSMDVDSIVLPDQSMAHCELYDC
jgi:hypothetical protein